jgi:hypothetical protein
MDGGLVHASEEGTPQGSPLSPLLSNVMLDDLDWELERRGHRFVRCADDGRIYVRSERAGERVMQSIGEYVERRLKLRVNHQKSAVDPARKRALLGFRFFGRDREVKVRIDPQARMRAKDRLRQLTSRKWGVSMERRIEEINRFTVGWTNYFALADTPSVFEGLDEWLRRRLRQVRWKEWKRPRTRERKLKKLGIPKTRGPRMGLLQEGLLAHLQLPDPLPRPAQRLLGRPRPEGVRRPSPPIPGCDANRRMRTRTSGGVGGAGVSPAPTRSTPSVNLEAREVSSDAPVATRLAYRTGGVTVIGVNVRFEYDGTFDRSRVINVADHARAMFEGMPGLRFKFFTFDEEQQRATNFYVWESKEAAVGFFSDELRERVTDLYGVGPTIEFVEIAQIVDNSAS